MSYDAGLATPARVRAAKLRAATAWARTAWVLHEVGISSGTTDFR